MLFLSFVLFVTKSNFFHQFSHISPLIYNASLSQVGTYKELVENGNEFAEFLNNYHNTQDDAVIEDVKAEMLTPKNININDNRNKRGNGELT